MKEKLHQFHLAILVFMIQSGVTVFSLPRVCAEYLGTNGWLFIFIAFMVSSFNIWLIYWVYRLGDGRSVFDILEQSFPKFLLYPAYCVLAVIWGMVGDLVAKQYVLVFQMIAFPTTNPMIFKLMIDIIAFLLLIKGIYNISKAATLLFGLFIWMVLLEVAFLSDIKWVRLTPFVFQGGKDAVQGGFQIYQAFIGYELILFLFPYVEKKSRAMLGAFWGNAILTITYVSVSIVCFGFFSLQQLKKMMFPLLDLLAYIRFPFIERIENLLYGFFIFTVLITTVMYWWVATEALQRIFKKAKRNLLSLAIGCIAFGVCFIPKIIDDVQKWLSFLSLIETAIAFGLPLLLIMILLIQKSRRTTNG